MNVPSGNGSRVACAVRGGSSRACRAMARGPAAITKHPNTARTRARQATPEHGTEGLGRARAPALQGEVTARRSRLPASRFRHLASPFGEHPPEGQRVCWGGGELVVVEEGPLFRGLEARHPIGPRPELWTAVGGMSRTSLVEPHVGPPSRHDGRHAPPRPIGQHPCRAALVEGLEDVVARPRVVAELEGGLDPGGQEREEVPQQRHVGDEVRRELEQDRTQLRCEDLRTGPEEPDGVPSLPEPPDVCDVPARLDREGEAVGRLVPPPLERRLLRQHVERVVHFDRREDRGVVRQPRALRTLLVERLPPRPVLPPAGAHVNHAERSTRPDVHSLEREERAWDCSSCS